MCPLNTSGDLLLSFIPIATREYSEQSWGSSNTAPLSFILSKNIFTIHNNWSITTLSKSRCFLCLPLKIPFPGASADGFQATFPFLQTSQRDSRGPGKGFLFHAQRFPIDPDSVCLSVAEEAIVFIQEIFFRNTVGFREFLRHFRGREVCPLFQLCVGAAGNTHPLSCLPLRQVSLLSTPANPFRNGLKPVIVLAGIPVILVDDRVPIGLTKNQGGFHKAIRCTFSGTGFLCVRIAFSTHRAA